MARGQQKIQSQQKAAEKTAKAKKQQVRCAELSLPYHHNQFIHLFRGIPSQIKKQLQRKLWAFNASCVNHKCQIPKPTSSTLRTNIQNKNCLPISKTFKFFKLPATNAHSLSLIFYNSSDYSEIDL